MGNIFYLIYCNAIKHKWLYSGFLLILLLVMGFAASRINLEEDITKIIPKDDKIEKINALFDKSRLNNLLIGHIYLKDTTRADPARLIRVGDSLITQLDHLQPGYVSRFIFSYPDSLINMYYDLYYKYLPVFLEEEDYAVIKGRITESGLQNAMRQNLKTLMSPLGMASKKMIVRDPLGLTGLTMDNLEAIKPGDNFTLYQNHLFTEDQKHLLFFVELSNPPNETKENKQVVDALQAISHQTAQSEAAFKFEYFGSAAIAVANADRIKKDIIITINLAMAILFLLITFFYRRLPVFFMVILPGAFGALIGAAFLATFRENVSTIALGVGSVLLGITVDYALHFFTHYKHQKNVRALFDDLTTPVLMSSFTTSCAFFALLFIRSEALQELGLFAGVSVVSAAIFALTVLPHLVIVGKKSGQEKSSKNMVERIIDIVASYPVHRKKPVMVAILIITVASLVTGFHLPFEKDMLRLNYMPDHLTRHEKNLNAITDVTAKNLFVVSSGKNLNDALHQNRDILAKLDSLKQENAIIDYRSLNALMPDTSVQVKRIEKWNTFWNEHRPGFLQKFDQAAKTHGFITQTFEPFISYLNDSFTTISPADAQKMIETAGSDYIIRGEEEFSVVNIVKINPERKEKLIDQLSVLDHATILDKGYVTNRLVEVLNEDFNRLIGISLTVVFIILLVVYGRIELSVMAFLPILLGWVWTLGLMHWFDLKFNIVNIIICTFIFGLGIDYSIFIMRGLTQQYAKGISNLDSYKKSILISALTTLMGIGVLIFAQHPALKSIAALAIFGITSSILLAFTAEHTIYHFLILRRKQRGVVPFTLFTLGITLFAFLYFLLGCVILLLFRVILGTPIMPRKMRKNLFHIILYVFCKSIVYILANTRKIMDGRQYIDFNNPSVIIANHHSFIDILLMLSLHSKLVMVTNQWVYHSPIFGKVVQFADFILAAEGLDYNQSKIERLISQGYSIVIFPEGTRSTTARIGRFHKGAFYLATQFNLDIQPVMLHGTHYTMPKKDGFYLKNGTITIQFLPRIAVEDEKWGATYQAKTKSISKYFKQQYQQLRERREYPGYFKEVISKNFLYKGPVLEWYVKVKFYLEKGYRVMHELIPTDAAVVDIGCGYGYMSMALGFSADQRSILALDYDEQKIGIAQNAPCLPNNLTFEAADACTYSYPSSDVFILSDVLHYLTPEEQQDLLNTTHARLRENGKIIIREGDTGKVEQHGKTVLTEIFSTKTGFNKTRNTLYFISENMIKDFAGVNGLSMRVIDRARFTSNRIFVLEKKAHGNV